MAGPALPRVGLWGGALAGALLLLAAVEASTATGAGGLRASRDTVRVLLAVPLVAGAVLSLGARARAETIGFTLAAASLLAAAAADSTGAQWVASGADAADRLRRETTWRALGPLLVLGLPALAGAVALGIPWGALWVGERPVARAAALAAVAGALLFPVLNTANVFGNAAVRAAMASGATASTASWPTFEAALARELFPVSSGSRLLAVALRLGLAIPLLEVHLHAVLRQAFLRWGAVPFVVGTAFLAPLLLMDTQMSFGVFLGALVTGWLAARTASVLPGIAFWFALFLGQVAWLRA